MDPDIQTEFDPSNETDPNSTLHEHRILVFRPNTDPNATLHMKQIRIQPFRSNEY